MTTEERTRVGRKLRALRTERGLHQADVARDPKADISLGTLQAIEGNWYEVRDTNIEKYARYFGTTCKRILADDQPRAVASTDPLLQDLNEEHLQIARSYMRARKRVRACIELLLAAAPGTEEPLTSVFMKLEKLPADRLAKLDTFLSSTPDDRLEDVIDRVRQRAAVEPTFLALLEESLTVLPKPKPEPKSEPKAHPQPKKR